MMAVEASSPLAALQPGRLSHHWPHNTRNIDNGFLRPGIPARTFNFNDMRMTKSNSDYFSFKPNNRSSPTQSLVADLSQNFHIDQSPQLPTPRRSLFSTNIIRDRNYPVVTPPIPSSSPGPQDENMDCSPLPHKLPPRMPVPEIPFCLPPCADTPMVELPVAAPQHLRSDSLPEDMLLMRPLEERKKLVNPTRPCVRKGLSSSNIPTRRPRTAETTRPFMFGAPSTFVKSSLAACMESPPSERKLVPSLSNPSLIPKDISPLDGSPIAPIPRVRSAIGRHRNGLSRRTLSVQHNDSRAALRAEKRSCTTGSIQPEIMLRDEYVLKLPHFRQSDDPDGLPRITRETMLDVLDGKYVSDVGDVAVIDCRFEYEYTGGHIAQAMNFNDKEEMARKLFDDHTIDNKVLIFHCEYSHHRAPIMARYIRERDRLVNLGAYPRLTYPEVYILDGGFKSFYTLHGDRCIGSYIEMDDKEHERACEQGMAQVNNCKKRAKLSRAKTYAFGQAASTSFSASPLPQIPTGFPNLQPPSVVDAMDIDLSSPVELKHILHSPLSFLYNRVSLGRFDSY